MMLTLDNKAFDGTNEYKQLPDDFETFDGSSVSTSSPVCGTEVALQLEPFWSRFCGFSLPFILLSINNDDGR